MNASLIPLWRVVVLSNNDGCAISRSEEAKALGIEMGAPAHLMIDKIRENGVAVFSSNYALYGDMSDRVMKTLAGLVPRLEVYSIDEAFLDLDGMIHQDLATLGKTIFRTIGQDLGLPVCVGIAPTKTLAKMANRFAKKRRRSEGFHTVSNRREIEDLLQWTAVGDIWGVGPQYQKLLVRKGMRTAFDLARAPVEWVRKNLTVVGQRMVHELQGTPAKTWEFEAPAKKNICTARGFGKLLTTKGEVATALANYTASCAEKLRAQGSCASRIQVFVQTNAHRFQDKQYFRSIVIHLPDPSQDTGYLIKQAGRALDIIFRDGYNYQKCGITVMDLVPEGTLQQGLFSPLATEKQRRIMETMDRMNRSMGKDLVRIAAQGFERRFKLRQAHLSKRYTTRLHEILEIYH